MKSASSTIPVYPTLPLSGLVNPGTSKWKEFFPFSSPTGVWTFSGRVSLYLGLPVLKLPKGSTILFPSYYQYVEIDTLLAAGFKLKFYRVREDFTVDLDDAEQRLGDDVSALYIIHYFGFPQPLVRVREFCDRHGLALLEDCALSLFSRDERNWLGTEGDLALYSVYKTLPLPHGGFLVTKNEKARGQLKTAPFKSTFLQTKDLVYQNMRASGWDRLENSLLRVARTTKKALRWDRGTTIGSGISHWDPRLLEYRASPLVLRLMRLSDPETVIATRRKNFLRLISRLRGHIPIPPPFDELPEGVCPLFVPALVDDKIRFQEEMAKFGVQTVNLWQDRHPACPADLADEVTPWRDHIIELPIHQGLLPTDIDRVAETVLTVLGES